MHRIMVFGESQHRTHKTFHILRAFREEGNEAIWLDPARIRRRKGDATDGYILNKIGSYKPDIIFIRSNHIPLPVLEKVSGTGIKTVLYHHNGWRLAALTEMAKWGRLVDLFLSNARGLHDQYRELGIKNPIFIIEGCDRHDHRKRRHILPVWESDVAFIGRARKNDIRVNIVKELDEICKVRVYGKFWKDFGIKPSLKEVGPRGYAKVCSGAKIVLGVDADSTIEGHWTNRLWLTLGCGGFHLTNYVPGMEEYFINRHHLVWYHDMDECLALVREYLQKPEERKVIADQGYRYVHEHHTFNHFVRRVLELCDNPEAG